MGQLEQMLSSAWMNATSSRRYPGAHSALFSSVSIRSFPGSVPAGLPDHLGHIVGLDYIEGKKITRKGKQKRSTINSM